MGILLSYICSECGYASGEVALGPAPYPDKFDPVLVSCPTCATLEVVHRPEVASGCSVHGTALVVHRGDDVPCPRCANTLQTTPVAMWD